MNCGGVFQFCARVAECKCRKAVSISAIEGRTAGTHQSISMTYGIILAPTSDSIVAKWSAEVVHRFVNKTCPFSPPPFIIHLLVRERSSYSFCALAPICPPAVYCETLTATTKLAVTIQKASALWHETGRRRIVAFSRMSVVRASSREWG